MAKGRRVHPEEEYARTYWQWRGSVERNRTPERGRNRETAGDYYERTYRQWRADRRDGSYRQIRRDDAVPVVLPLTTRLKMRYTARRWLLFVDAFGVLVALNLLVFFGIRSGALRGWGNTPRSMKEATGAQADREQRNLLTEDEKELRQRKINQYKLAPNEYLKP